MVKRRRAASGAGAASSPTVSDVARYAECSTATVSRVLNNPDSVGAALRERIYRAVEELRYVPNASARALRSARSRLIGLVVPTLNSAIFTRMVAGLEAKISAAGASLIHYSTNYDLDQELHQVRTLVERGVDGIVLVGAHHRLQTFKLLRDRQVRFAVTYAMAEDASIASMGFDNMKAGGLAAAHFCDLGHKHLAVIVGITRDNDRATGRVEGFLDMAARRGIERSSIQVIESPYEFGRGRDAVQWLLNRNRSITGIFCASDVLAVGALKGCRDLGLRVPTDISIIGFDNLDIADYVYPSLTSIDVPAREMGERAAEYLLAENGDIEILSRIELETHIIVRDSTAIHAANS